MRLQHRAPGRGVRESERWRGKIYACAGAGTFAVNKGLKTTIADLDQQQQTTVVWETTRARHDLKPLMDVRSFRSVADAVSSAKTSELLILDMAGKITDGATEASAHAHLLVQPTSPSSDDLHISVLVFLAMERISVARDRLAFALSRVLSAAEEKYARSYLASFGYVVLKGSIPEHLGYREGNAHRSIGNGDRSKDARWGGSGLDDGPAAGGREERDQEERYAKDRAHLETPANGELCVEVDCTLKSRQSARTFNNVASCCCSGPARSLFVRNIPGLEEFIRHGLNSGCDVAAWPDRQGSQQRYHFVRHRFHHQQNALDTLKFDDQGARKQFRAEQSVGRRTR